MNRQSARHRDLGNLPPASHRQVKIPALPLAAFACAASGRLLQGIEIRFVWSAGTALPLLIVWALFGPLISDWRFPWLVWLGLTISCEALREIVRLFERVFVGHFA